MKSSFDKNFYMKLAINEARKSKNDIPIGCVIVKDGEIIASFHNEKEKNNDVSAHAEILALREASKILGGWRILNCEIYITLEPCPMCAYAILSSGIKNIYFGAYDDNYGSLGSKIDMRLILNKEASVIGGIMENETKELLVEYFKKMRN